MIGSCGCGVVHRDVEILMHGLVYELLCVTGWYRNVWGLGNWVYQCGYFSVRLWLVFVLHAFSVG
jgi:hypothetical protein